ncbi:MAG: LON peptidase substrate-binding domain-containing protein, partial [Quisquiliibacterium sp.]
MSAQTLSNLPIFPLGTVLFPESALPLRVFEARYMDMVRDCLQADTPFGVCLIVKGNEVGAAAEHEAVGCLAKIADWEMEQLGLLQIRARGAERFSINDRRVQSNGLIRADATLIPPDPEEPIEGKLGECAILLRRIVQDLVEK